MSSIITIICHTAPKGFITVLSSSISPLSDWTWRFYHSSVINITSVRLHLKVLSHRPSSSLSPLSDCTWSVYHSIHHYNCYCISITSVRPHLKVLSQCPSSSLSPLSDCTWSIYHSVHHYNCYCISITSLRLHLKCLSQCPSLLLLLYQHYLCQTAPEVSITVSVIITVTVSVLSVRLHLKCISVSIIITVTVSLSVLPLSHCTWSVCHSIHHYNCYCYQYYLCQTAPEMAITASIIITVTVSVLSLSDCTWSVYHSIHHYYYCISITFVRLHLKCLSHHHHQAHQLCQTESQDFNTMLLLVLHSFSYKL